MTKAYNKITIKKKICIYYGRIGVLIIITFPLTTKFKVNAPKNTCKSDKEQSSV